MCSKLKMAQFRDGLEVLGTDECGPDGEPCCGVFEESALERVLLP